jgi:hypothetical protein
MSIVIWMALLTTSLYVVANKLPTLVGSFRFFWGPLALILIMLTQKSIIFKGSMPYLIWYGLISLVILQYTLWSQMLKWDHNSILEEFYAIFIFIAILNFYNNPKDFKGLAMIGKLGFIFIFITVILSHLALFYDPYVIRQSASPGDFTLYQAKIFKITGAAGYGYMQALVCLLPIIIYHIKYKKRLVYGRKTLIAIFILILFLQIRAQIFANLLVSVVITILAFIGSKKAKKSYFPIAMIVLIFLLIPTTVYSDLFLLISTNFGKDTDIHYKLVDFANFIQKPEINSATGTGMRAARYPELLKAFMSNPLFGNAANYSPIDTEGGGHLHWMNRLAFWGIIGFGIYLLVFYKIYKDIRKMFDDSFGFYYFLSVMTFIVFGLIKTIAGREPFLILILIIPGLYFFPLIDKKNKVNIYA